MSYSSISHALSRYCVDSLLTLEASFRTPAASLSYRARNIRLALREISYAADSCAITIAAKRQ
ncbi:hypothetical protein [Comamonas thiooxydans]|uniref:hypothetical protein n=1 Tax=Comamonas thiooxydans TaxID=363952 RepID=UPI00146FE7E4|nr:hypothetical protein [Comamonas thiooxydans]